MIDQKVGGGGLGITGAPTAAGDAGGGGGGAGGRGAGGIMLAPLPPSGTLPVDCVTGMGAGAAGAVPLAALAPCAAPVMNASLPVPASMIPLKVPVKKVAMGIINSKNLLSTGLIAFRGWVTNMILYSTVNTMPTKVNARQPPINTFRRIISSSSV